MAGDKRKAEATYKALLTDERTRFVGVRGTDEASWRQAIPRTQLKLAEARFDCGTRRMPNRVRYDTADAGG